MEPIDWSTLTPAQARRLSPSAARAERKAADVYNASGKAEDERAMLAAYTVWEDLQVFIHTGERPAP